MKDTITYADRREELIRAVAKRRRKINKCVLVCANCHRELEAGITQLPNEN